MSEQHVSVFISASVKQVYALFTHFNDFPKYMHTVKEVTYSDTQHSHWVVQVGGTQEWDAVNEDWIPERQIGWRSTKGLQNRGKIKFAPLGTGQTRVDVFINHTPPLRFIGKALEWLGMNSYFQAMLEKEMRNFARMVEAMPPGASDPMMSHFLFQKESAVTRGTITERQQRSMEDDPMMSPEHLRERERMITHEQEDEAQETENRRAGMERRQEQVQEATRIQREALKRQGTLDQHERRENRERENMRKGGERELDSIQDTLGGRNASMERTAFGDQDARHERFPRHQEGPMTARSLKSEERNEPSPLAEEKTESQWKNLIRGRSLEDK